MMHDAVPAGQEHLEGAALRHLGDLTRALVASRPEAQREYRRFLTIGRRSIGLPGRDLDAWLRGKTILVTGGTGCIGSTLMGQGGRFSPGRLASVSRGSAGGWARRRRAESPPADIRDRCQFAAVINSVRPDVVFHVAAQRDPG